MSRTCVAACSVLVGAVVFLASTPRHEVIVEAVKRAGSDGSLALVGLPNKCAALLADFDDVASDSWADWTMALKERVLLKRAIEAAGPSFHYVEFGSGGSTKFAAAAAGRVGGSVCSYEMDPAWHLSMTDNVAFSCSETRRALTYYGVDTGAKLGLWSKPVHATDVTSGAFDAFVFGFDKLSCDGSVKVVKAAPVDIGEYSATRFAESSEPLLTSPANDFVPDVVLIDGRFRVAIALAVAPYLKPESIVLIHDWTKRMREYRLVLRHFDVLSFSPSEGFIAAATANAAIRKILGVSRAGDDMSAEDLKALESKLGASAPRNSGRRVVRILRRMGVTGTLLPLRRADVVTTASGRRDLLADLIEQRKQWI